MSYNKHPLAWWTLDGPKRDTNSWAYKMAHGIIGTGTQSAREEPAKLSLVSSILTPCSTCGDQRSCLDCLRIERSQGCPHLEETSYSDTGEYPTDSWSTYCTDCGVKL